MDARGLILAVAACLFIINITIFQIYEKHNNFLISNNNNYITFYLIRAQGFSYLQFSLQYFCQYKTTSCDNKGIDMQRKKRIVFMQECDRSRKGALKCCDDDGEWKMMICDNDDIAIIYLIYKGIYNKFSNDE
ncbi:hypothetical protein ACJX0J_034336 [Zea mays]